MLAINFVGLNENTSYTALLGNTSSILPVAILSLPLFDTITVFYRRIRKGHSPFDPGQDHIHHSSIKAGFGHKGTTIILYVWNIFILLMTLSVHSMNNNFVLATVIFSMFLLLPAHRYKRRVLQKIGMNTSAFSLSEIDQVQKNRTNQNGQASHSSSSRRSSSEKAKQTS